jgi:hypothetical protein
LARRLENPLPIRRQTLFHQLRSSVSHRRRSRFNL